MLSQHVIQRERAVACALVDAVGALTKHHAFEVFQYASLPQLRQHAVDTIFGFVDILKKQDRTIEIWQIRRSCQRCEHREVAAQ